jgi:hypothetical protein
MIKKINVPEGVELRHNAAHRPDINRSRVKGAEN